MSDRWAISHLTQTNLELALLPGIGGRLWDIKFKGQSLLFQNPDLLGRPIDDSALHLLPTRSPHFGFPLWGGEKTWIAPDRLWVDGAPFPELDSGPYDVTSSGVDHIEMTSGVCSVSKLSVRRRITLKSDSEWTITHSVTNHGVLSRETGIWSVMMLKTPAKIGLRMDAPMVQPIFGDAGAVVSCHGGCVVANCTKQQEFKVGLANPDGDTWILFGADGPLLRCTAPKPFAADKYAHQTPVEIFNSGDYPYCEAEWHSPVTDLNSGETLTYKQAFHIWPKEEQMSPISHEEFRQCMS